MENKNEVTFAEGRTMTVSRDGVDADIDQVKDLVVKVQNPQTIRQMGKPKCVSFQLSIENAGDVLPLENTDHVRRTFLNFVWLREILKKRHGNGVVPPMYKEYNLAYKTDFYYIVKQQKSLCDFTEACFKVEKLRLDPIFWLFYESDLTINELEDFNRGKFTDDFLNEIWAKNGITKTPQTDYWDIVTSDEYYDEVISNKI